MKRVLAKYNGKTTVFAMDSQQDAKETIERLLDDHGVDYGIEVKIIVDNYKPLNLVKE